MHFGHSDVPWAPRRSHPYLGSPTIRVATWPSSRFRTDHFTLSTSSRSTQPCTRHPRNLYSPMRSPQHLVQSLSGPSRRRCQPKMWIVSTARSHTTEVLRSCGRTSALLICLPFAWSLNSSRLASSRASRPTDFSYKHDAKHISTVVVAQLWDEDVDERVLCDLAERVGHAGSGLSTHCPFMV